MPGNDNYRSYFTQLTLSKALFYIMTCLYVIAVSVVVLLEPFMNLECELSPTQDIEYANPSFVDYPCRNMRRMKLLLLTEQECDFGRRLVVSVLLGGIVGWERRQSDRPAGIRTMAVVALGSCLFSICSAFAFISGPMEWDASRVAAAIPSGVGFLGAGLIFKHDETDEEGEKTHSVHGLTTAASLWLSAAVGIACGGELYFVASYSVACMMLILRFGPRISSDSTGSDSGSGFMEQFGRDPEMQPLKEVSPIKNHLSSSRSSKKLSERPQFGL